MAAAVLDPTINLSASTVRAPYSTSAAPSMADSLPPLNFGFDDLRARMAAFTARFDDFIERGRKRVLDERTQFRVSVAEVLEQETQKRRDIAALTSKTSHHAEALAAQTAEADEMHAAIDSLSATRDARAAEVEELRTRLASVKSMVGAKRAAQREYAARRGKQAGLNRGELEFWEGWLGLRIEGAGRDDRVRFVFVVGEREREGSFELDMSGVGGEGRAYEVVGCRPQLDQEKVDKCVEVMCRGDDLAGFLKGMRELFVEEMR